MMGRLLTVGVVTVVFGAGFAAGWLFGDQVGWMRGHREGTAQTRARMLGQEHRRHVIPVTGCPECGKATP